MDVGLLFHIAGNYSQSNQEFIWKSFMPPLSWPARGEQTTQDSSYDSTGTVGVSYSLGMPGLLPKPDFLHQA